MVTPQLAVVLIRDLFAAYKPECAGQMPVKVDQLRALIEQKCGIRILLSALKWPSRVIKGRMLRYRDRAEITVSHGLNTCWTRFVAAKELAHLLLDREDQGHYTTDPEMLIERLVKDQWHNNGDMKSERLAVIGAIEMLIPQCCHPTLDEMVKAGKNPLQIATHFMVPERMIDRRLDKRYQAWVAKTRSLQALRLPVGFLVKSERRNTRSDAFSQGAVTSLRLTPQGRRSGATCCLPAKRKIRHLSGR